MIDVLKRLAELDATNPNVIKESSEVAECGPMGMMSSMDRPSTPASINMTAGSGEELGDMLAKIMSLAGMSKVEPEHLGVDHEPAMITAEPVVSVGPAPSAGDEMRSVIDKMHDAGGDEEADEGAIGGALGAVGGAMLGGPVGAAIGGGIGGAMEEETDEGQYDNTPNDPRNAPSFDSEEFAHHENNPGAGEASNGEKRQSNLPTATYENLMAEYRNFVAESDSKKKVSEAYGRSSWDSNMPGWQKREQDQIDYAKQAFKRAELQHELGHEDDPEWQRAQRDHDRGPWYIKINGKILRSKGEIKVFDWKKGANNYALAILKNKPELQGKVKLTKSDEDDIMIDA